MASKTVQDSGATNGVRYFIDRNPLRMTVVFKTLDGDTRTVDLSAAEIAAATTPTERTSLQSIFDTKLYAAALAKAGFTG